MAIHPPRWLVPSALAALPLGLAAALLGGEWVTTGESHRQIRQYSSLASVVFFLGVHTVAIGLGILGFFFFTRSAVRQGHWKRLAKRGPLGTLFGSKEADLWVNAIPTFAGLFILTTLAPRLVPALVVLALLYIITWLVLTRFTRPAREPNSHASTPPLRK